jgi:hypothetical protein
MVVVVSRNLPVGIGHCINYYDTLVANLYFATTRELDVYSSYVLICASGVRKMISWDTTLSAESSISEKGGAGTEALPSECWTSISGWTRTLLAEYTHAY